MAYAFSAIDELLSGQDPNQQSNIFGQGTQSATGSNLSPNPSSMKTVDEGTSASTPANLNAVGGSSSSSSQSSPLEAEKVAVKANIGKTTQPLAINNISRQLEANNAKLQSEANDYLARGKANQSYGIDSSTLDKAIGANRDNEAWGRVSGFLGQKEIAPVESFNSSVPNIQDVNLLGSNAGLKDLISRGQDSGYTRGMASFDLRALQKTPGFSQQISDIQRSQQELADKAATMGTGLRADIENYRRGGLSSAQADVRSQLASKRSQLEAQNEAEAKAYNQALQGVDLTKEALAFDQKQKELAKARVAASNPYAAKFVEGSIDDPNYVNPLDYLTKGAQLGRSNFISAEEAARYNNILSLLGEGGQTWSESAPPTAVAANYTGNEQALQDYYVNKALGRYGKFETKSLDEIQKIKDASQRQADFERSRVSDLLKQQSDPRWVQQQAESAASRAGLNARYLGLVNPNEFYSSTPGLNLAWENTLTKAQAAELNRLGGQIGQGNAYTAGDYQQQNPYGFNETAYLEALRGAADRLNETQNQQRAEAAAAERERLNLIAQEERAVAAQKQEQARAGFDLKKGLLPITFPTVDLGDLRKGLTPIRSGAAGISTDLGKGLQPTKLPLSPEKAGSAVKSVAKKLKKIF